MPYTYQYYVVDYYSLSVLNKYASLANSEQNPNRVNNRMGACD